MPAPRFSHTIEETFAPPVMEARRWLAEATPDPDQPLLNLSQAAPVAPPPRALREAIAEAALTDDAAHLYGPVLGLPDLRDAVAARWTEVYGAPVSPGQVAITSGCNEAFAAAISVTAAPGEEVILPTPWYFNHKMWLDMAGIRARLLPSGDGMLPDPEEAAALIGPDTRAIVLVTPNNPTGAEYPAGLIARFAELARSRGLRLILDETYRDFHSGDGAPHRLFEDPDWGDTVIQLYSFSKVYRLTGHRVGALVAGEPVLAEVEKFLDTVTICPNQLGQRAALYGLRHLSGFVADERAEVLRRRAAMEEGFSALAGWQLLGCGAYFAYLEHPFDSPSDTVAQALLRDKGVLVLPGTMFAPTIAKGGDGSAEAQLRIAFANADLGGIATLFDRLKGFAA
ncbi:aminotransferase [Oceanomicrobium pacificus]|uniref:aspartate transaminase n=1 Tax=Oceanomicrobium pacificus TaxID=2692916 RepID=A0A6B0U4E5_9RHOB|nr:aminotransferase [Oceanomicrobium pacificus]MXU65811.1 aminotransferase [Oceanomicrobium pacificus]